MPLAGHRTDAEDHIDVLVASTGTPQGPFGFDGVQGYQTDSDSGLMLLGYRYYDPSTDRFLTRDPAQDGRNWYEYCNNAPLKYIDTEGLEWHDPAQVHVSPNFPGKVWVIGEPSKTYDPNKDGKEDQVNLPVPPGHSSPTGMDLDIVVIVYPDGRKDIWFLMGVGYVSPGSQDYYVDKNGNMYGPLIFDALGALSNAHDWLKDIEKAKKNPLPPGYKSEPQPCYLPGKGPFGCE